MRRPVLPGAALVLLPALLAAALHASSPAAPAADRVRAVALPHVVSAPSADPEAVPTRDPLRVPTTTPALPAVPAATAVTDAAAPTTPEPSSPTPVAPSPTDLPPGPAPAPAPGPQTAAPAAPAPAPAPQPVPEAVVPSGLGVQPPLTPPPAEVAPPVEAPEGAQRAFTPLEFGAAGDGTTDDTAALRRALAALSPGDVLVLPGGRAFRHTDTLRVTVPGVTVSGTGTLLATDPRRSAVIVQAADVTLEGVTLRTTGITGRLGTFDDTALSVVRADGFTARDVTVDGAASAGVLLWGAGDFELTDLDVRGTHADGIHITGPSHDGRVVRPVVRMSGDDGVAVVSYAADGEPVRRVTVTSPRVLGTTWGRGLSVVGGEDVTFTDVWVQDSSAAAVYVATEASWSTLAPVRVLVDGGTLLRSNTSTVVDHGAVLVYDGRDARYAMRDVTVRGLTITDTRATASRQVGFLREVTGVATGVRLVDLSFTGTGPRTLLDLLRAPTTTWTATGWRRDGVAVSAR